MDPLGYEDYEYEVDPEDDVEYLDYYDDEVYEIPETNDAWEEEEDTASQFSAMELYEYCVVPTFSDSLRHLGNLLLWSLIFTLTTRIGVSPDRLASREFWWADAVDWHTVRGAQMIILMKIVSVGYDLDAATLKSRPSLIEMTGYVMHPGSVIFGPWMSFGTYKTVLQPFSFNFLMVANIVSKLVASAIYLLFSTCFVSWLVPDNISRWMVAFRKALSFRSSHYFVSYFSEASAHLAGLEVGQVARPSQIEMPRSLVEVVIFWNMPMHHWLKTYVFKPARYQLGTFGGLLFTYCMSAMFHGLNFQLGSVLLSLGFYTYVEYTLRQKLSNVFDACVLARRCSGSCNHVQKRTSQFCMMVNAIFGALAVFHLAYLGVMFDAPAQQEAGYSMKHTMSVWSSLNYASHWIIFICYIMSSVI